MAARRGQLLGALILVALACAMCPSHAGKPCQGNPCGKNSICTPSQDKKAPVCSCKPGYVQDTSPKVSTFRCIALSQQPISKPPPPSPPPSRRPPSPPPSPPSPPAPPPSPPSPPSPPPLPGVLGTIAQSFKVTIVSTTTSLDQFQNILGRIRATIEYSTGAQSVTLDYIRSADGTIIFSALNGTIGSGGTQMRRRAMDAAPLKVYRGAEVSTMFADSGIMPTGVALMAQRRITAAEAEELLSSDQDVAGQAARRGLQTLPAGTYNIGYTVITQVFARPPPSPVLNSDRKVPPSPPSPPAGVDPNLIKQIVAKELGERANQVQVQAEPSASSKSP